MDVLLRVFDKNKTVIAERDFKAGSLEEALTRATGKLEFVFDSNIVNTTWDQITVTVDRY